MLSDTTIAAALADRHLTVGYAFVPNAEGVWVYQEPTADASDDADGKSLFHNLCVKSRVALTTGPLVKPLTPSPRVARTIRFEGHDGVVDLRRANGGFRLQPGQAALVLTNEQIDLTHQLGALVLGRVSSYSDGLVVNASYLDPTWSGLIKLHVHNTSQRPVTLRLGNEIGRMFLFDTSESTPDPLAVAHQGLHYGYSWKRIFDDGIDPFPERAPIDQRPDLATRFRSLNEMVKRNVGYTLIGALALGLVPTVRLVQQIDNWSERFDQLDDLEAAVGDLGDQAAATGIETITWAGDDVTTEAVVALPDDFRYNPDRIFSIAIVSGRGPAAPDVVFSTTVSRTGGQARLTIRARRRGDDAEAVTLDETVDVRWLVVP